MELEVIVAVKNIVFTVILIVNCDFDGSQTMSKFFFGFRPLNIFAAICISSPIDVAFCEVRFVFPVLCLDQIEYPDSYVLNSAQMHKRRE